MGDTMTISTCGKCGLHYRESLIPHECAEWTKGRKEVAKNESMRDQIAEDERYDIEEQPMSNTLPEREDQMGGCTYSADGDKTYCGLGRGGHLYADHFFRQGPSKSEFDKVFSELEAPNYPATCDDCGAEGTNESLEAHVCNKHQVTKSGTCAIPGCPCRGWSAQEGAGVAKEESMNTNDTVNALKEFGEVVEQMPSAMKDEIIRQDERERLQEIRAASHQPAARGGGDEWSAVRSQVGSYIWRGKELVASCGSPDAAAPIVAALSQYQSLVAEREQMVEALKGVAIMLNTELEKYDKEPWAQRVRAALSDQKG